VVLVATLAGCNAGSEVPPTQGGVDVHRLDAAVVGLSTARRPLLAAVDAVQSAATALDEADAVCATGDGAKARTAYRAARPKVLAARKALADLLSGVAGYERALSTLGAELDAGSRAVRQVLSAVVRDGKREAAALGSFRTSVGLLWPSYDLLASQEQTWITRALTPWYRSAKEGASAYAILSSHGRSELTNARESLAMAAHVLNAPSAVQSATLRAADQVLAQQRTAG
jgi:hypothetical protein